MAATFILFKLGRNFVNLFKFIVSSFLAAIIFIAIPSSAMAQNKILKADGTMQAHSSVILMTVLGKIYQREIDAKTYAHY